MSLIENISRGSTATAVADVQSDFDYKTNLSEKIESRITPILLTIQDQKKKESVEDFFNNHFFNYLCSVWEIASLIEKDNMDTEYLAKEIFEINHHILDKGDFLESFLDSKKIIREVKDAFRDLCKTWTSQSRVMTYAFEKPRGYAGDYEIIEMLYNNQPLSTGIGYCFDYFSLRNSYAYALRGRKEKMKELLLEYLTNDDSDVDILNIACGPCREIKELFAENNISKTKKITFNLVDHDIDSLKYAERNLESLPSNVKCRYIHENVLDFINNPLSYYKLLGEKDYIYSIGLFDYLPDRVLNQLILFLYTLLKPYAKFVFGHKDSKTYKPLDPDWFCDWKFYHRDKKEVINMVTSCGIGNHSLKITREITKIIFMLTVQKID